MTVLDVFSLQREKVSQVELGDEIFNVPIKGHVLHQVVVGQLENRRSGSASTKGRSEVRSSGRKLWRQKGTGRARVGAASSPTRRGGGTAFGPTPRRYQDKVPKKVKKAALRMALTGKLQADQIVVIDKFDLPEIKTKDFLRVMENFDATKALIVTDGINETLERSSKNVPWVKVLRHQGLNVFDILKYDQLFLERGTINRIAEALVS